MYKRLLVKVCINHNFFRYTFFNYCLGRPHSTVGDSRPQIYVSDFQESSENSIKRLSKHKESYTVDLLDNASIDGYSSTEEKSSSLPRSGSSSWISPFSKRKLKKSRTLGEIERDSSQNPNFETSTYFSKKVS